MTLLHIFCFTTFFKFTFSKNLFFVKKTFFNVTNVFVKQKNIPKNFETVINVENRFFLLSFSFIVETLVLILSKGLKKELQKGNKPSDLDAIVLQIAIARLSDHEKVVKLSNNNKVVRLSDFQMNLILD